MSVLLTMIGPDVAVDHALPEGSFKPFQGPFPVPDLALVNAGQGDARSLIRPNVKQPEAPSVAASEHGAFITLSDWLSYQGPIPAEGVDLILMPTDDPLLLAGHLKHVRMIGVEFAKFNDGRGYSIATLLRTRLKWTGELRAVGDVAIDQLFLMARCGFSSFALRAGQDVTRAKAALRDFPAVYQTAADGRVALLANSRPTDREAA